ncbi:Target of rapamycin complex 1 subunit kog1, partial [Coemansia sp. RSA 2618]
MQAASAELGQQQTVTTASGIEIDMHELTGNEAQETSSRHGGQRQMDGRADFHTHPRSLALANMQLDDWRPHHQICTKSALLATCLDLDSNKYRHGADKQGAILEAWTDPSSIGDRAKRYSTIAERLTSQFQNLPGKITHKPLVDCDVFRLQRNCLQFRNESMEHRVIFYYNGHGMPVPTADGSFWVFHRQTYGSNNYMPVSADTLNSWLGSPVIYIWECSNAMSIVKAFDEYSSARSSKIAHIRSTAQNAHIKVPPGECTLEQMAKVCALVAELLARQQMPNSPEQHNAGSATKQQHAGPQIDMELIRTALFASPYREDIHFAATQANETLPTNPELPADLFTACLTTPVKAAVRFWVNRNPHIAKVTPEISDQIPGCLNERSTPLGELYWILTAITDTIAWSLVPHDMFQRLFRQDPAVATLCRNFILADRIMRHYGVRPQSSPEMPSTHMHPLWESLDYEIDMCLRQLPGLLEEKQRQEQYMEMVKRNEEEQRVRANRRRARQSTTSGASGSTDIADMLNRINTLKFEGPQKIRLEIAGRFNPWNPSNHLDDAHALSDDGGEELGSNSDSDSDSGGADAIEQTGRKVTEYVSSPFFVNQLRAFEIWLQHAAASVTMFVAEHGADDAPMSMSTSTPHFLEPPEQLPIVLQLGLSRKYQLSVLLLLHRFISLGPWAVNMTLLVGFFPYLGKMFSSSTVEVQELTILIWARLIATDPSLCADLLMTKRIGCFIKYLASRSQAPARRNSDNMQMTNTVVAACAFICTTVCKYLYEAQKVCTESNLLTSLLTTLYQLDDDTTEQVTSRTWIIMCIAELWKLNPSLKQYAISISTQSSQNAQTPIAASAIENARGAQDLLIHMSLHRTPVVRAAAIYAMGTLVEDLAQQLGKNTSLLALAHKAERQVIARLLQAASDGSPIVRREVVCAIGSAVFASYMPQAIEAVARVVSEEMREKRRSSLKPDGDVALEIVQDLLVKLYKVLLKLSMDGHPDVALLARETCDTLMQCYAHSLRVVANNVTLCGLREKISGQLLASGSAPVNHAGLETTLAPPGSPCTLSAQESANVSTANIAQVLQQSASQQSSQQQKTTAQSAEQRAETMRRIGQVEQAWLEWGRRELRETVCVSTLLDWAGAHFTEFDISLFANVSGPLQSSASLVETRERNRRMDRMESSARVMGSQAGTMRWMDVRPVASMKEPATTAIMHPLESHAIVASSRGTVSVFDWEAQAQVGHYSIGACGSFGEALSISSLHLVNPLGQAKLLVGTRDGKVRIFASHAPDFVPPPAGGQAPVFPRPRLLTAFTALPWASLSINVGQGQSPNMLSATTIGQNQRLKQHQHITPLLSASDSGLESAFSGATFNEPEGCGLVTAWNQRSGVLFAGGNDKEVRVWDIASEMC